MNKRKCNHVEKQIQQIQDCNELNDYLYNTYGKNIKNIEFYEENEKVHAYVDLLIDGKMYEMKLSKDL